MESQPQKVRHGRLIHHYREMPPERRPQDPTGDGAGWTFKTAEHCQRRFSWAQVESGMGASETPLYLVASRLLVCSHLALTDPCTLFFGSSHCAGFGRLHGNANADCLVRTQWTTASSEGRSARGFRELTRPHSLAVA